MVAAVAGAIGLAEEEANRADAAAIENAAAAKRAAEKKRAVIGTQVSQQIIEHRSRVEELADVLAPGLAGASWADERWADHAAVRAAPAAVRVGTVVLPAGVGSNDPVSVPLALPLLNHGSVAVTSSQSASDASAGVVRNIVVRLLASVLPGELVVTTYDPRLRGSLAPLGALHDAQVPLLPHAITDEAGLEAALADLTRDVSRVTSLLGGKHATLGDLEQAAGETGEPYRLLVLFDAPSGLSQRAFDMLLPLVERGPGAGVSVVLQVDPGARGPQDRDINELLKHFQALRFDNGRWQVAGLGQMELSVDEIAPPDLCAMVAERVREQSLTAAAPALPLTDLLPASEWQDSSAERIEVALGRSGQKSVGFTLGDRLAQHHNVLVGGAVGQGKSNALLTLIHGVAARYSPEEVEMYLLDFKEGVEFAKLAPQAGESGCLPHARVIGVDSDRAFGLAVLRHIRSEFDRRAAKIKAARVSDVAELRRADPEAVMPRVLVVLDEFQVLFERSDAVADEAAQLLDTLARKGRAYGIHLVLASQTLSGIQALVTREDAILSQVPVRLALKTTASESQVLLSQGNTEASRLRFRGEAVLNTDFGQVDGNRRITVAFADPAACQQLRRDWASRSSRRPTAVVASEPARFLDATAQMAKSRSAAPMSLIAEVIGVGLEPAAFRFDAESGRHLAIIGPGSGPTDEISGFEALSSLQATCLSLGLTTEPARFVLMDFLSAEQRTRALIPDVAMTLQALGHEVEVVDRDATVEHLALLGSELGAASSSAAVRRTFVVGWGFHRAIGIDNPDPISSERPVDVLHRLIKDGPTLGYHLIGWWNSHKAYEQHIESNFSIAGLVQGFLFLRASSQDVSSVVGPFVNWDPSPNRGLMYDRAGDNQGQLVRPFALLSPEDIRKVAL